MLCSTDAMIKLDPIMTGICVALVALGLCFFSGLLSLKGLTMSDGVLVGASAGLAGYYGALTLKDWKPPGK